jgi:transposase
VQLRDVLSSSEIAQLLKKVGIYVEIAHLKAVLKELGFPFNGKSCSLVQLFSATQHFLYGQTEAEDKNGYFQSTPKNQ